MLQISLPKSLSPYSSCHILTATDRVMPNALLPVDPMSSGLMNSTERISSSPKSARSTASLASTVQARGRASSSLPQTPAGLEDIDELKASAGKAGALLLASTNT